MKLTVVNEQDEILGYKDHRDRQAGDIVRISYIWLLDSSDRILLAQRAFDKPHDPGKWSSAVAGRVEEGETYESNFLKEVEEEIGVRLDVSELVVGVKRLVQAQHPFFCQGYFARRDVKGVELRVQAAEVADVKWVSFDELVEWFERSPDDFVHSFHLYLDDLKEFLGG